MSVREPAVRTSRGGGVRPLSAPVVVRERIDHPAHAAADGEAEEAEGLGGERGYLAGDGSFAEVEASVESALSADKPLTSEMFLEVTRSALKNLEGEFLFQSLSPLLLHEVCRAP